MELEGDGDVPTTALALKVRFSGAHAGRSSKREIKEHTIKVSGAGGDRIALVLRARFDSISTVRLWSRSASRHGTDLCPRVLRFCVRSMRYNLTSMYMV